MSAKILIADDEADIVSMLGSFFKSKGYAVLTAANGTETLKQVEHNPDIIFIDICMPDWDGLEVCKHVRDYISCPILFLTARIEDTDKVKGFAVGGDDYIVKPFSLMELEFFPMVLPLSETNPLFRYIGLLLMYHAQFVSLMSMEQMSNGAFYAVWAIPAAWL